MRPTIRLFLEQHGAAWLAWAVPTDGVLYAAAFFILVWLFIRRARVLGVAEARALEFAVVAAFGAALGTRFYYILVVSGPGGLSLFDWFNPALGTASWGAYLGAAIGIGAYALFARINALSYLDVAASCAPLGTVIGRIGCFLRGDDYGTVAALPWAVSFPQNSIPYNQHVAAGLIDAGAHASLPVHPLQLYLAANAVLVFIVVSAAWRRWKTIPGRTLSVYFVVYGATRFCWEFLRDPGAGGPRGGLSSSQSMCLVLIGLGSALAASTLLKRRATSVA
jgi:phosphatidylglycerol---prolipoprotein diacylglyceryl transferase